MSDADDLMDGYTGDEPYPDDDHSLGLHEDEKFFDCPACREELLVRLDEEDD